MPELRKQNLQKIADMFESQRALADALDTTPGYINQLLTGARNIGEKTARKFETKLGLASLYLDGCDFIEGQVIRPSPPVINVEPGPDVRGRVPLISWVQAGDWAEVIDNHLPGQADEWRLTTAKCSKNAFALRVVGDSMTNPYGSPSIPDGYIVIVEPNRSAKNGDIVVARLDDSMEATLKKLVIEGNTRYLKPLNPSYPVIHINGNCTICGVVIKVEFDL